MKLHKMRKRLKIPIRPEHWKPKLETRGKIKKNKNLNKNDFKNKPVEKVKAQKDACSFVNFFDSNNLCAYSGSRTFRREKKTNPT